MLASRLKIEDKLQEIVGRKRINREWALIVSRTCKRRLFESVMESVFKQDMQNTFIFRLDSLERKLAQKEVLSLF